ncbi:Methyltransferase domain-containing protein [Asanoa ishikariensis]|uniref:Methyltransferase domain-containing protein n=1 Tax=Asanoa ishikariensis TaxID=137265 RepID=A0A1H3L0I7_9ACTN|nr:class I SAM-dependent methyltransferase [Asanoa ishikariensis]SDY57952.1 Methyltransferase domain-containing protein [Asanoa ishikariensis]
MLRPEVLDYYQRGGEHHRLTAGAGRLEFLRTWDVLTRVLPAAPSTVLDVGGATGVYAVPLAAAGCAVRVVDPVPEHVAHAATLPGVTAVLGDARALPAASGAADAVLLFGPLYHLLSRTDRVLAWREAARVTRPGGVVVGATISRFASFFDGFVNDRFGDAAFRPLVEGALSDGMHRPSSPDRGWFTSAYFHHPDEPAAEAAEAGLVVQQRLAVESPLWMVGSRLDEILASAERTALLLEMLRQVEAEPTLLGASSHQLTVAVVAGAAASS